jgi:hypothetical protein
MVRAAALLLTLLFLSAGCQRQPIPTSGLTTVPSVTLPPSTEPAPDNLTSLSSRQIVVHRLGIIGQAYKQALQRRSGFFSRLAQVRMPPLGPPDLEKFLPANAVDLKSPRDGQPFVIIWGVDLDDMPVAAQDATLLAWESTPDPTGQRCALFCNGFAGSMAEERFQTFPRATPRHPPADTRSAP